ncbi:MAG TPA: alanine--tRNA ligase [Phycisphaerae bacterium]|nr:alanine--tRNA ligase [Phycisphaerae bacterium]
MTSREIRRQFIDFFVKHHGHQFVPSSPVVPHDDPTLLFTNAGMNQFKPYFLGTQKAPWKRVANTQKCIRAGGKHNDLDDVGRSRRHHTFFEMLGNWSFGDYFKDGAIEMAWELLTRVWKLDPKRLHVSVYAGNSADGVPADDEAAELWKKITGMPNDHIHRFVEENFWEMGETGPCGPCTEIFIDRTPDLSGGGLINGADPRVMEIWNLVFIQYNRNADRKLTPLSAKHVDTGMGLERICQVIQGKNDNYATDLWTPLFTVIGEMCAQQYTGLFPSTDQASREESQNRPLARDIAFRVIADHIRCLTFALTDGAVPSNEGRGYVLRRILRRAVRFGRQNLALREPFLHRLVPVVVDSMADAFPELKKNPQQVAASIRDEEESFSRTLDRGLELFGAAAEQARFVSRTTPVISAENAFKLHDTYGFPIDLTQIMAREQNLGVDVAGYEKLMLEARELARSASKSDQHGLDDLPPNVLTELGALHIRPTDDQAKYDPKPLRTRLASIWDGARLLSESTGLEMSRVAFILDKTNFYAEMGGQIGDCGEIISDTGSVFVVENTRVSNGYILHIGHFKSGRFQADDSVTAQIFTARQRVEKNHTGTHLLNWALREVCGDHVQQKGSLVDDQKLRFDFSQPQAMTVQEITRVEDLVAEAIGKDLKVYSKIAPLEEAKKIFSLRAIFGEKYPPQVRVVSIGVSVEELLLKPENQDWRKFSIEFCGGTHLPSTGNINSFTIVAEESVSKGVRRVVALTGEAASSAQSQGQIIISLIADGQKASHDQLPTLISALQKAAREHDVPLRVRRAALGAAGELQEKLKKSQKAESPAAGTDGRTRPARIEELISGSEIVGGVKLVVGKLDHGDPDTLRSAMDSIKKRFAGQEVALLLASTQEQTDKDGNPLPSKVNLLAAVSDSLVEKIKAGDWVKQVAPIVGGSGGGRPQMAMAGGKDIEKIDAALSSGRDFAKHKLT